MTYRVLLVDDIRLVRDSIKAVIEQNADFRINGEAENADEAL